MAVVVFLDVDCDEDSYDDDNSDVVDCGNDSDCDDDVSDGE